MFRTIARRAAGLVVRFITRLDAQARIDIHQESLAQHASRRLLAVFLIAVASLAATFPGLHPQVARETRQEITRIAVLLWDTPLNPPSGETDGHEHGPAGSTTD